MSSMPLCWSWMAFRYEKCAWALVLVWPGPGMTHVPVCHMCVTATHGHNRHTNLKWLCYILSIPICNTNMYFISTVLPTWYQYHNNKTFKYMVENLHKSYKHWVAFLTITPHVRSIVCGLINQVSDIVGHIKFDKNSTQLLQHF